MTLGSGVLSFKLGIGKNQNNNGKNGVGGFETIFHEDGFFNFSIITDETPKSIIAMTS